MLYIVSNISLFTFLKNLIITISKNFASAFLSRNTFEKGAVRYIKQVNFSVFDSSILDYELFQFKKYRFVLPLVG